jgi:uncharacterized membrane protein
MERSVFGTLGKRLVAYAALVALGLVVLKVLAGVLIGLVTTVLTMVAVVAVAIAAFWLYRRL